jgi:hypothetical protein
MVSKKGWGKSTQGVSAPKQCIHVMNKVAWKNYAYIHVMNKVAWKNVMGKFN